MPVGTNDKLPWLKGNSIAVYCQGTKSNVVNRKHHDFQIKNNGPLNHCNLNTKGYGQPVVMKTLLEFMQGTKQTNEVKHGQAIIHADEATFQ
jgi:hypothetical protein